jgi:SAM-dependent methyltransferase
VGGPQRHAGHHRGQVPDPRGPGPDLSGSALGTPLRGAVPSPNIWHRTADYEVENRAFDRAGLVEDALREVADWSGRDVLDLGCGTGFHLPLFAREAGSVTGVEPHPDLVALARRRVRGLPSVRVLAGTAQDPPLPPASVDVVHARWAYFFGPGCEPGLAALRRVVRHGGAAVVVDNDASRSTFGGWFRRGYPHLPSPTEVERFWSTHGWTRRPVLTAWTFDSRRDLERVVRIELPTALAEQVLTEHDGTEVEYAVNVWWRTF